MSNYRTLSGKTIDESFEQFHKDNPFVYQHFCDYAIEWLKTGAKKISSKQIIGRIRWFLTVETKGDEATKFKINDIMTSRYARKFLQDFPEYENYFELRELRS